MSFSQNIALLLDDLLKEIGYDRGLSIFSRDFSYFKKEELAKITKITLRNAQDISFLKYLPNLRKVKIGSMDYREVFSENYENNEYSNNIIDFSDLETLENLESLEISNDVNIRQLNLENLKNLKRLILINNPRLTTIKGIKNLHCLQDVCLVGNHIMKFENFDNFLLNTLDAKRCIIDIDAYLWYLNDLKVNDEIQDGTRYAKTIYNMALTGNFNYDMKFSEQSGFSNYTTIHIKELTDLYCNLTRKLRSSKVLEMPTEEQIGFLYDFGRKIPVAMSDIRKRNDNYLKIRESNNGAIPEYYEQSLTYLHNSYITYHFKKGNCEGIVNLLHVMASILGLESQTVYCHDRRDPNFGTNHALLRIKNNGVWRYYDPTIDRESGISYYDMDIDAVLSYADLPAIEEKVKDENDNKEYNRKNINRK